MAHSYNAVLRVLEATETTTRRPLKPLRPLEVVVGLEASTTSSTQMELPMLKTQTQGMQMS